MFYYLLIILSAIGIAANFALTKGYLIIHGNTLKAGTIFNCLVGLSGSIIYFFVCDFKIEITWFSAILAFLFTLFVGFYTIIGFKIMSMGNMAVYTVFLMLGGMILPYFYGMIFLKEQITVMKVFALILMIFAIIFQNDKSDKSVKWLFYILCIVVFFLNGGTSIISKLHQTTTFDTVSANGFVLLRNISLFLFFGAMIPFVGRSKKGKIGLNAKTYLIIFSSAIVGSVSYLFQLICAAHLPATIQFPIISGGSIVFTAVIALFYFRENFSKVQLVSIILCTISSVIFAL